MDHGSVVTASQDRWGNLDRVTRKSRRKSLGGQEEEKRRRKVVGPKKERN
jgi:hypothetical protein